MTKITWQVRSTAAGLNEGHSLQNGKGFLIGFLHVHSFVGDIVNMGQLKVLLVPT